MQSYLLALEIHPMTPVASYEMLLLHCTLVHWFKVEQDMTPLLRTNVKAITDAFRSIVLTAQNEETFTGMTRNGPVPVTVNTVTYTDQLRTLHEAVCKVLEELGAQYSIPSYVHSTYVPHVTHQTTGSLPKGESHASQAVYLISADAPSYGNPRLVEERFGFGKP